MNNLILFLFLLTIIHCESCVHTSMVLTLDNVKDNKYDLVITLTTYEKCNIDCTISHDITPETKDYSFSNRQYYVYKFNDLEQNKEYIYNCGKETNKITFPSSKTVTRVAAFGDWGESIGGNNTLNYLKNKKYDAILHLGDLAYNLHTNNGDVGNSFMTFSSPITSKIPFMVVSGNHEAYDNFNNFIHRYNLPNKEDFHNLYFSFDINNVHFIAVNSEFALDYYNGHNSELDKQKFLKWFNDDLNNSNSKFKVVYMHRALYTSWEGGNSIDETIKLKKFFEDLFFGKIDIVLSGHVHNYERTYPIYKEKIENVKDDYYTNPKYPTYQICGSGGSVFNLSDLHLKKYFLRKLEFSFGICELIFDKDKIISRFIDTEGNIKDQFIIKKTNTGNLKVRILSEEKNDLTNINRLENNLNSTINIEHVGVLNFNKSNTETDQDTFIERHEEDLIAKHALIITVLILIIFLSLFSYNIIKCYRKSEKLENCELQIKQDDSIVDLNI